MAAAAAAGTGGQTLGRSSFSRAASSKTASSSSSPTASGVKLGPNGAAFVSSGIPDLDRILGGGFLLGSVVMVMEDSDAPHHLLLLRAFMSQGVVHKQPLLFAAPMKEPRSFLGALPAPVASSKEDARQRAMAGGAAGDGRASDEGLRIAWQYRKYFGDERNSSAEHRGSLFCFLVQTSKHIQILKPSYMLPPFQLSFDILDYLCIAGLGHGLVSQITEGHDEDKDLAKLLTGYQDMVGFLHVHKVAQTNSQVPVILEASTFSLKLRKRRSLVLERLNQAPVDGSSGPSSGGSGSCSSSTQGSQLDF
ncbi:unnamed protein product [Triticum turgidum subsp. durum]|uniref:Elongator complex protein 4 n=1 Tax=Triticum turgidum subsp. durum TaxID=4567 RepID=A0A9R0ZNQ2_TRITD|nr:unnamed protein product [Triticum turgidum subsp. durum]